MAPKKIVSNDDHKTHCATEAQNHPRLPALTAQSKPVAGLTTGRDIQNFFEFASTMPLELG